MKRKYREIRDKTAEKHDEKAAQPVIQADRE
jgi:hypothetical protein